jgi:hypothetical protein
MERADGALYFFVGWALRLLGLSTHRDPMGAMPTLSVLTVSSDNVGIALSGFALMESQSRRNAHPTSHSVHQAVARLVAALVIALEYLGDLRMAQWLAGCIGQ